MKTNTTDEILTDESAPVPDPLNPGKIKGVNHFQEYRIGYILLLIVTTFFLVAFSMFLLKIESAEDNKFKRLKLNENFYK